MTRRNDLEDAAIKNNGDPFMTLVDAAAALLDSVEASKAQPPQQVPPIKKRTHMARKLELMAVNKKQTFAEELMDILDDEANHDVLNWMPDGTAFTVVNHRKFTLERMPKLFKIHNMSSFVRKLTRWGFQRVHDSDTRNSDVFKHPFFHRGKRDLVRKVRCLGVGPVGVSSVSAPALGHHKPQVTPSVQRSPKKKLKESYSRIQKNPMKPASPTKEIQRAVVPVTPGTPKTSLYHETSWSSEHSSTSSELGDSSRSKYERFEAPLVRVDDRRAGAIDQRLMILAEDSRLPQALRSRLMAVALDDTGSVTTDSPVCYPYGPPLAWAPSTFRQRHVAGHSWRSNAALSHPNDLMSSVPPRFLHHGYAPGYMH